MIDTSHQPICPKCGYDQSGEIATWDTQCPLDGRCTECAYTFEWVNIIDPARVDLIWYAEHARRKRDLIWRTPKTLLRLLIPNHYWREVGVHTRIRFRTLLLWLLLILCVLHTLALVPVAMGNWHEQWGISGTNGGGYQAFSSYGYVGYLCEIHNAIFTPFLRAQYGSSGPGYRFGMNENSELQAAILIPGFIASFSLMWMIIIWVLPVTRARSSLRAAHLIRATLITTIPVMFFFELVRVITGLPYWNPVSPLLNWIPYVLILLFGLTIIWIQWFWIAAMKIGWGIRPVWHIAILGSIASLLTGAVVFVSQAL